MSYVRCDIGNDEAGFHGIPAIHASRNSGSSVPSRSAAGSRPPLMQSSAVFWQTVICGGGAAGQMPLPLVAMGSNAVGPGRSISPQEGFTSPSLSFANPSAADYNLSFLPGSFRPGGGGGGGGAVSSVQSPAAAAGFGQTVSAQSIGGATAGAVSVGQLGAGHSRSGVAAGGGVANRNPQIMGSAPSASSGHSIATPQHNVRRNTQLQRGGIPIAIAPESSPVHAHRARSVSTAPPAYLSPAAPSLGHPDDHGSGASPAFSLNPQAFTASGDLSASGHDAAAASFTEAGPQPPHPHQLGTSPPRRFSQVPFVPASHPLVTQQPLELAIPCVVRAFFAPHAMHTAEMGARVRTAFDDHLSSIVATCGGLGKRRAASSSKKSALDAVNDFAGTPLESDDSAAPTPTSLAESTHDFSVERCVFLPPLTVSARPLTDAEQKAIQTQRHVLELETERARSLAKAADPRQNTGSAFVRMVSSPTLLGDTTNTVSSDGAQNQNTTSGTPLQEESPNGSKNATFGGMQSSLTTQCSNDDLSAKDSPSPGQQQGDDSHRMMMMMEHDVPDLHQPAALCESQGTSGTAAPDENESVCTVAYPVIPQGNVYDVYNSWVLQSSPSSKEREEVLRHIMFAIVAKLELLHASGRCHGSLKTSNIFCTQHVITAVKRISEAARSALSINGVDSLTASTRHATSESEDALSSSLLKGGGAATGPPSAAFGRSPNANLSHAASLAEIAASNTNRAQHSVLFSELAQAFALHSDGNASDLDDVVGDAAISSGIVQGGAGGVGGVGGGGGGISDQSDPRLLWFNNVVFADGGYHELEHLADMVRRAPERFPVCEEEGSATPLGLPAPSRIQENSAARAARISHNERALQMELRGEEMCELSLFSLHHHDYIPPPEAVDLSRRVAPSAALSTACRTIASQAADIWNLGLVGIHLADGGFPAWLRRQQQPTPVLQRSVWSKNFFLLVQSCTHRDPAARPTATELRHAPWFTQSVGAVGGGSAQGPAADVPMYLSTAAAHGPESPQRAAARIAADIANGGPIGSGGTATGGSSVAGLVQSSGAAPSPLRQLHLLSHTDLQLREQHRRRDEATREQQREAQRQCIIQAQIAAGARPPPPSDVVLAAANARTSSISTAIAARGGAGGDSSDTQPPGLLSVADVDGGVGDGGSEPRRFVGVERLLVVLDEVRDVCGPPHPDEVPDGEGLRRRRAALAATLTSDGAGDGDGEPSRIRAAMEAAAEQARDSALLHLGDALMDLASASELAVDVFIACLIDAMAASDDTAELVESLDINPPLIGAEQQSNGPGRHAPELLQQQAESDFMFADAGGKMIAGHVVSVGPQPREFANYEYCKWRVQSGETLRMRGRRLAELKLR